MRFEEMYARIGGESGKLVKVFDPNPDTPLKSFYQRKAYELRLQNKSQVDQDLDKLLGLRD